MAVLYYKSSALAAATVMLAAYLLTMPSNLLGELAALFWVAPYAKELTKILDTVPLIFLIFKYVLPIMHQILLRPHRELWLLLTPTLAYYIAIYVTSVYTRLACTGNFTFMSLLVTLLCFCTFIYVFMDFRELSRNTELRKQRQTINDYAVAGNINTIQNYIRSLQSKNEDTVVHEYCKNESVNLILSSYARKAKRQGTELFIFAKLPKELINELNVCVVLANGLENALHACAELEN